MIYKEYNERQERLSYFLPWAYPLEESIIINKNGSLQSTFSFRGDDLDSSTVEELISNVQRLNNGLKRLGGNWTLHTEARRSKSKKYVSKKGIKDIPTFIIELEREEFFKSGIHYESEYFFTLTYKLPSEKQQKFFSAFIKSDEEKTMNNFNENLKYFKSELESIFSLLKTTFKEMKMLNTQEMLSYYHSCISDKTFDIKVPETPILIDSYISDCDLVAGLEPKLGNSFLGVVSVLNFPSESVPGLLDKLNRLNLEYKWITRFICIEKLDAQKSLSSYYDKWFGNQTNLKQMIKEMLTNEATTNINVDALNKANDINREKALLEADETSFGYYTTTIVVTNNNRSILNRNLEQIKNTLNSIGFTAEIESFNSMDSWLGGIPGNIVCNVRRPIMNTITLSHLLPISAVWAGDHKNDHLSSELSKKMKCKAIEPPLLYTQTSGNTPFRINIHYNDIGHTLICGPTGSGKSVLLALMTAEFKKYTNAQVFTFDKGASTRVLTKATGGSFYDLGEDNLRFQPLANCDNSKECEWCQEWIEEILEAEEIKLVPEDKQFIWNSLTSVASLPKKNRTLSSFVGFIGGQSTKIKEALTPYVGKGAYAKYFDGNIDSITDSKFQVFEMEKIAQSTKAITPTLSYLFHKIETEKLDGSPTLITLDECWMFFDNEKFEAKIREWLKVLRKKNASVVFATQELSDIATSNILPAVLGACYTKIFLPDVNAKQNKDLYNLFGLNEREIEIIQTSIPKMQYYYKSPKGSRLFELALSPLELSYVATSGETDQIKCKELDHLKTIEFNKKWLNYKEFQGTEIINNITKLMEEYDEKNNIRTDSIN